MLKRKRRTIKSEGVRLNMAAMLDMAFQLLAFFIATFKPMTLEQQIALKLPPPEKIQSDQPGKPNQNDPTITLLKSLRIGLEASPDGELAGIVFIDDGSRARALEDFQAKLKTKLDQAATAGKETGIEQIIMEIDPRLSLQHTMEAMDKVLMQKTPEGKQWTKLSPVLARPGGGAK